MSRRLQRVMDGASVLFGVAALALLVWPARETADAITPPASLSLGSSATDGRAGNSLVVDSTVAGIVRGNVFSASRRAPATRFMPPSGDPSMAAVAETTGAETGAGGYPSPASVAPSVSGDGAAGTGDAVPALYGIVAIEGVRHALLALRGDEPPRLFAVGDRHAGYRVSAIESDRVVLATSRGSRTLRLAPPASRDTSENLP